MYIIKPYIDMDNELAIIGTLVRRGFKVCIEYKDPKKMEYLEESLIYDFGEPILESGTIVFQETGRRQKRKKGDVLIDEKHFPDYMTLEKILDKDDEPTIRDNPA